MPSWVEEVCRNEQVLMAAGGGWPLRAVSRIRVRISPREPRFGLRRKRREKISRAVIHGGKKGSGRFLGPSVQAPGAAVKVLNQFFLWRWPLPLVVSKERREVAEGRRGHIRRKNCKKRNQ